MFLGKQSVYAWNFRMDPEHDPERVCFMASLRGGRELQGFFEVLLSPESGAPTPVIFTVTGPTLESKQIEKARGPELVRVVDVSAPFVFAAPADGDYELCFHYGEDKRVRDIAFFYDWGDAEDEVSELLKDAVKQDKHLEPLQQKAVAIMHELRNVQIAQMRMRERIRQNLRMLRERKRSVMWMTLLELLTAVGVCVVEVIYVQQKLDTRRFF
ncbi:hypothetical protein F1559_001999 [Cyanidiococcus yangmingshanensis]|uniref:GOLD domain-containing protein n=1 Tax=Cyanidiococcus yangmingshanensis TaxID=2690220 RepID=A0A7J7ICX5_9RHOD|nr:hypothetical protein F1559_001999 [Cyanidiococcus yangmingshanensis]